MKTSKIRTIDEDLIEQEEKRSPSDTSQITGLLNTISKKLSERDKVSDTLDLLVYKVEKIEESQDKIINQLNDISNTLYEPDRGVFARLKENSQELKVIEESGEEEKKNFNDLKKEVMELSSLQRSSDQTLKDLVRWKNHFSSVIKWAIASILTPGLAMLLKYFYEKLFQ